MRLTPGLYGHEFTSKKALFGLRCGQMRGGSSKVTHNSGWYNHLGEKLGWGDLDKEDLARVAMELQDDEVFVVLSEHDSFWNFVEEIGTIGSMCRVSDEVKHPGTEYLLEHAMYIVVPGEVYWVDHYNDHAGAPFIGRGGLAIQPVCKERAREILYKFQDTTG